MNKLEENIQKIVTNKSEGVLLDYLCARKNRIFAQDGTVPDKALDPDEFSLLIKDLLEGGDLKYLSKRLPAIKDPLILEFAKLRLQGVNLLTHPAIVKKALLKADADFRAHHNGYMDGLSEIAQFTELKESVSYCQSFTVEEEEDL